MVVDHKLYFGKHRGKSLSEVPSDYLGWALRTVKLSSGLRAAIAAELEQRGGAIPPAAPGRASYPVRCHRCGSDQPRHTWQEDRTGRRLLRRECGHCGTWLGFAPQTPPFTTEADATASKTPILDALVWLDELEIDLHSDGASVWPAGDGEVADNLPRDLADILRQCNHRLARLLGRTAR